MTPLKIGTRRSRLAIARAEQVATALRTAGYSAEITHIQSPADPRPDGRYGPTPYVHALSKALVDGVIDVAVHSYKDLPVENSDGLTTAAILKRGDVRDVLVSRGGRALHELRPGATIGVSATRRRMQLDALGLDLTVLPLPGSVDDFDARLAEVTDGRLDAVVLGRAGLTWLGLDTVITQDLEPLIMLPAAAQGAIACQCRTHDPDAQEVLSRNLHHHQTATEVEAERAALAAFVPQRCSASLLVRGPQAEPVPFGVLATLIDDELILRGAAATINGEVVRASVTGPPEDASTVGPALADELVRRGAFRDEPTEPDLVARMGPVAVAEAVDDGYGAWLG